MGFLTRFQQKILECLISLSEDYGRAVKSEEIAETLGVHPGSVRNALSVMRILGFVESKRGPFGGYLPTGKAISTITRRDRLSVMLLTSDGSSFKVSSTITACLTDKNLTLEIRNFTLKPFIRKGNRVVVCLGKYFVDGVIVDSDRVGRRVVVIVKRLVKPRSPVRIDSSESIRELLRQMSKKKAECALIFDKGRLVGYLSIFKLLKLLSNGQDVNTEAGRVAFKPPSSRMAQRFLEEGYCLFDDG
ncbi:MAG: Rrf2 family transcriptional regulator [Thermosphaera sp.]|nr:Rrf2 family transcriptional regulator [Thermosphaera aggregans]